MRTLLFLLLLVQAGWGQTPEQVEAHIVELSNQVRQQQGLGPLKLSPSLQSAARSHSQTMLQQDFLGHGRLGPRLQLAGFFSPTSAENLFQCSAVPVGQWAQLAIDSWLASPAHRHNLLNPKFNRIGVGLAGQVPGGSTYFTQDFGYEAIEVLHCSLNPDPQRAGYQMDLEARCTSGATQGAFFLEGRRVSNWQADGEGLFQVRTHLPGLGRVQLGQAVGPSEWSVEAEWTLTQGQR